MARCPLALLSGPERRSSDGAAPTATRMEEPWCLDAGPCCPWRCWPSCGPILGRRPRRNRSAVVAVLDRGVDLLHEDLLGT